MTKMLVIMAVLGAAVTQIAARVSAITTVLDTNIAMACSSAIEMIYFISFAVLSVRPSQFVRAKTVK